MRTSRRFRFVAVIAMAAVTGAAACARPASEGAPPEPAPVRTAPGREVTLAPRQSATVEGGSLAVELLRVTEDSRCPRDVQCVRAGEARVELLLTMGDRAENAILAVGAEPAAATLGPYTVRLVGLAPVPTTAGAPKPEDYRATIRIDQP